MSQPVRRRVLAVHSGGPLLRGSELALLNFLGALRAQGREALLLCDQESLATEARRRGVQVVTIAGGELMYDPPDRRFELTRVVSSNFAVMRAIRSWTPDVVYCNGGRPAQYAAISAKLLRVPLVVHLHAPNPKRYLYFYGVPLADAVVHCSDFTRRYHEARVAIRRSCTILNGLDQSTLPQLDALDVPLTPTCLRIRFVGSLIPRKGIDLLIEAAALLRDRGVVYELEIAGRDEDGQYRTMADARGLGEPAVRFLGELAPSEVPGFLTSGDVHVLPSRSDAFGLTVIEAAACGVPSIGVNVGGVPEAMLHGLFGPILDTPSAVDLADTIERHAPAFVSRTNADRVALASLARSRFDLHHWAGRLGELFDSL